MNFASDNTNPGTPTPSDHPSRVPVGILDRMAGGGFLTTLLIVLGVLFLALGIGAIVVLIIRQRRRSRER